MERNSNHNRGGDGLLLRSATGQNIVGGGGGGGGGGTGSPITSSPDLVLQWGNRKRLRCSKVQLKDRDGNKNKDNSIKRNDSTGSIPAQRTTARVDRRVIRSDFNKDPILNQPGCNGGTTGYINLRQRSASPAQRILRNSESSISMRGHRNGANGLSSPDGGGGQDGKINGNQHINQQGINYNSRISNNHMNENNNNNGSGSSDSKKGGGGGGSSSGSDAIPAVWPPKFVIGLTNKEKEEDFMAIKGSKLPQRPKKRAKGIQRNLNLVSPGAWLCDLTLERYEVREKKVTKKRPRGLKHMGNIDSDSE